MSERSDPERFFRIHVRPRQKVPDPTGDRIHNTAFGGLKLFYLTCISKKLIRQKFADFFDRSDLEPIMTFLAL